jgi:N-acyl homoserine lactone hydrolase
MKTKKNLSIIGAIFLSVFLLASIAFAGPPAGMKMYAMSSGTLDLDKSWLTAGRDMGKWITIPVPMFLVDHPKGIFIYDTGMNPEVAKNALEYWGPVAKVFVPHMKPDQALDKQVKALGYDLEDVKYIALSHMHLDHAGGMTLFPNATFIVRKAELQTAWWPESFQRGAYILKDYQDTRGYKYIELGNEDYDVFGDGSVVVIDSKGHTQGHQSVIVTLANSGKIVLTGDSCYMKENIDERVVPGIVWDPVWAIKTIDKMRELRKRGAYIIVGHDPDAWEEIKHSPAYYD